MERKLLQLRIRTEAREGKDALPPALLSMIPDRLRALSLLWASCLALALLIDKLAPGRLGGLGWPPGVDLTLSSAVLVSLAVFLIAGRYRESPGLLVFIGLAYEAVGALAMAATENQAPYSPGDLQSVVRPAVSWVAVWVILFPLVVPSRTIHTVISSLVSWSMLPLTLAVYQWFGLTDPDSDIYYSHLIVGIVVSALAVVPQRIIFKLGQTVQRARQMGSYRLERRIGSGGMGEVWLAHHRLLARPAAIKLILPRHLGNDAGSASTLARFEREARITAALRSPHTVELYDFGVSEGGTFYYVMEYLAGIDLDQLVKRFGCQPPGRVVHLLIGACRSLAEAHAAGLVHRDIKPANLILCHYGNEYDFLKVLDFGMVKVTRESEQAENLTIDGAITGTPGFLAPELALGDAPLGGAPDIYALGCVAYWLLTGQPVFAGRTLTQVLLMHVREDPSPPSVVSECEVGDDLDAIILRCLAKEPAQRFGCVEDLRLALQDTGLAASWTPAQAQQWWQTHLAETTPAGSEPEGTDPQQLLLPTEEYRSTRLQLPDRGVRIEDR